MGNLYICHTDYHLLIALIKCDFDDEIILFNKISDIENKIDKINKFSIFKKISVCFEKEKFYNNFDFVNKNIYLFNDWTNIGEYLRKRNISYNIIEDGYNYYSYDVYRKEFSLKKRIFNKFFSNDVPLGYSKYVKSIEVNDITIVIKDTRYKKMIEVPRKELFRNITEEKNIMLLNIFGVNKINKKDGKSMIILTQPLYQDKFDTMINSEEAQLKFYRDIVNKYDAEYDIYFKVHPRDNTNYNSIKNVIFLEKVPIELYEYVGNYKFDIGITHSSTALEYLDCVDKKIFLKDLRA